MLDKSENELAGVVSTAKTCVNLYNEPLIARNTSTSDFRITDLMNADDPVSLYGTPTEAQICTELGAQPPPGYAVLTGDCCDIDSGANPGVSSSVYFGFPDACGSYDWNCDGKTEQQQQCTYNASLACGAECTTTNIFGGGIINIFTEACH